MINTTLSHPFYVVDKGWVIAKDLIVGDVFKLANGEETEVKVLSTEELENQINVYNFEVEDWHTYFVSGLGVLVHNTCSQGAGKGNTASVGRWMSQAEYDKMVKTGKVQMSPNGNKTYVASPTDIKSYPSAPKGSVYVEFDVDSNSVIKAGKEEWSQIPGPGSLTDKLNQKKGLPAITDMPNAINIKIVGGK